MSVFMAMWYPVKLKYKILPQIGNRYEDNNGRIRKLERRTECALVNPNYRGEARLPKIMAQATAAVRSPIC
jgi:hypothetical protein